MRRLAAALGLTLVAGCGLPLPGGVQEPGAVPAAVRPGGGDIQVLPPGPRDDAAADDIVREFFGAQSDPANRHASAREFLAPELRPRWRDDGPVSVVGSGLTVEPADAAADAFRVGGTLVGRIDQDGSYSPAAGRIDLVVRVRQGAHGRWVISGAPDGLVLSTADRDRSFRTRNVYFLAPGATPPHLVPDPVLVPVSADPADAVVRRLLEGPSRLLSDSAVTAFPAGTAVRSVRTAASGLVTVDLSAQADRATPQQRQAMAAQLVWTLRSTEAFAQLRLQSVGRDLPVERPGGQGVLQARTDWAAYNPDGLPPEVPLYFVRGGRLRVLDPTGGSTAAPTGDQPVDAGAASPRGGELALLSRLRTGDELRTGPVSGPFLLRARGRRLSSPSWGSGERGVWFLDGTRLRVAPVSGTPRTVPVDGIAAFGPVTAVRVSRDGVRVALIAGPPDHGTVLVGRVVERGGGLRVVGLVAVARAVTGVRDLSWDSSTSLVVLGQVSGVTAPVRVLVDGSSVALVNKLGLEQSTPLGIAAAPEHPLLVGAIVRDTEVLLRDSGRLYVKVDGVTGGSPFYPG
jgi:hypothetical protein